MACYDQEAYLALQVRAVREHKWYLSERAKRDIGDDIAWRLWVEENAGAFRQAYERNLDAVLLACAAHCPDGCKGVALCDMDENTLHDIIILGH